jgi:hypothetical protein
LSEEPGSDRERRGFGPVVATVMVIAIGVLVAYFGLGLLNLGLYAFTQGEVLLGAVSVLFGAGLVLGPLAVLVSQVRGMRSGRG